MLFRRILFLGLLTREFIQVRKGDMDIVTQPGLSLWPQIVLRLICTKICITMYSSRLVQVE